MGPLVFLESSCGTGGVWSTDVAPVELQIIGSTMQTGARSRRSQYMLKSGRPRSVKVNHCTVTQPPIRINVYVHMCI